MTVEELLLRQADQSRALIISPAALNRDE